MRKIIYAILFIISFVSISNAASIQKNTEGLIFGAQTVCNKTSLLDVFVIRSGTYTSCGFSGVTGASGFVFEVNKPALQDQIFEIVSNTAHIYDVYVRYESDGDYYKFSIGTSGALNLYKCTPTCGSSLASGTATITTVTNLKFVATGSSTVTLKIYDSTGEVLTYSDSSSPLGSGNIRIAPGTSGMIFAFYQVSAQTISVSNLGAYRALLCDTSDTLIAADSSGTIDVTGEIFPIHGRVKVTSSGTSCTTNVLATLESFEVVGGDSFTYNTHDLILGPRVGDVGSTTAKIWSKFSSDASGKTMKVQYKVQGTEWPDSSCTSNCVSAAGTVSSSDDYADIVELTGLTAGVNYDCRVYANSTLQGTSQCGFKTTVASGDTVLKIGFASCLCTIRRPYYIFDYLNAKDPDIFILEGDNIYEACPTLIVDDVSDYTSGATRLNGYRLKYMDVFNERKYNDFMSQNSTIGTLDDHEIDNDYDTGTGTAIYTDTIDAYDEYISKGNPSPLVSGKRYWKKSIGNIDILTFDLISHRDLVADVDIIWYYGQNAATPSITNPDAETGNTTGWTCQDSGGGACATFTATTSWGPPYAGTYHFQLYDAASAPIMQQAITVVSGVSYSLTARIRGDGQTATLRVRTGSYTAGSDRCSTSTTSSSYVLLTCDFTASETTLYVQFMGNINGSSFMDNVAIVVTGFTGLSETKPSCTRDASIATRLNCTSTTFTTESPTISTTEGLIEFQGKLYQVSSVVDNDTIDTVENMPTGTDTTTRILKTGKHMFGREQMMAFFNVIADSTADVFVMISSKGVLSGTNSDDWSKYTAIRDMFRELIGDDLNLNSGTCNRKVVWLTGDNHTTHYSEANMLGTSSNCKEYELAASPVGPNILWAPTTGGNVVKTIFGKGSAGFVTIDTSPSIPTVDFEVIDEDGNEFLFTNNVVDYSSNSFVIDVHNQPMSVIDDGGYSFVLYRDSSTSFKIVKSEDTAGAFLSSPTNSISKSSIAYDNYGPTMAIDKTNNKLYVIYESSDTNDILIQSASFTSGLSWDSNETTVFNGSGSSDDYDAHAVILDSDGYIHVVAQYYNGTHYNIVTMRSTSANNLTAWTYAVHHRHSTGSFHTSIDSLGSGGLMLTMIDTSNGYLYYNKYSSSLWGYTDASWTSLTNTTATPDANDLKKTGGADGTWDAGAISTQQFASKGPGKFVRWRCGQTDKQAMVALSADNPDASYTGLDFAMMCAIDGTLAVFENGTLKGSELSTYTASDILSIELNASGYPTYRKNGTILYTSLTAPSYPLWVDTSIKHSNIYVYDVQVSGISGTVSTTAHTNTKFAPTVVSDGSGNAGVVFKNSTSPYPMQFSYYNGTSWDTPYSLNTAEAGLSSTLAYVSNKWYAMYLTKDLIRIYESSDATPTGSGDWSLSNIDVNDTVGKYRLKATKSTSGELQFLFDRNIKGINDTSLNAFAVTVFNMDISSLSVAPLWLRLIKEWQ